MDDTGDLAFELGFDRNDEAVATDSDEVFLRAAAFAEALQRSAETGFNRTMLALHGAANAAQLGGGVVVETAIGLDLAA